MERRGKGETQTLAVADKDTRRIKRAKARFVEALKELPNVSAACELAGVSRSYIYEQRERDAAFRDAWNCALEKATDAIEQKAYELALEGNPALIQFLLKAHRRNVYGDVSRHQHELLGKILILPQKADGDE
jgi:hypothetical protein